MRDLTFAYEADERPVLDGLDLTIPAGTSLAIVGQNGAGKTTLAKLLCRLYDPQRGAIEIDGTDLRELDLDAWRARVSPRCSRTSSATSCRCATTSRRTAPATTMIRDALAGGGRDRSRRSRHDPGAWLSRAAPTSPVGSGNASRSARALCAVRLGAGVVLLDEPTAQLDVRGEAEIFDRILAATRDCTTILISHRFSTVRHADRICVLEGGKVVELGSHDELMARNGRYRTMFDLQASRFGEEGSEEETYDVLS